MATNMVFGWPRWTPDVTWSGGSWSASYPVTNAGILPLSRVARSTNANLASTQIIGTFSKLRSVQMLGVVRHNLSLLARMRFRLYSDAGRTTTIYDSDWFDVWPSMFLPGDLEWEDDNWWSGKPLAEDLGNYSPTRPLWLPEAFYARAFLLEIDDTTNAAGYVQVGLVEVARGWEVSFNPGRDYSEGFRFRTEVKETLGGVKIFDRRDKPRVAQGVIESLPRDEAMARGFDMQQAADISEVFLWFPFPDETLHWIRTTFLGRLVDPDLLGHTEIDRKRFPFKLEEVL